MSTTKVEYVKERKSIQIISRIFVEDLEQVLQERYSSRVQLDPKKETDLDQSYLLNYISQKLKFKINEKEAQLIYIGKEYDIDILNIYFEIEDVDSLESIRIENKILIDLFPEQQNIIHFSNEKNKRNLILDKNHPTGLLNFN
ncbi:MAG: hypothetical protein P8M33_05950 [Flavobacteriaceae bacterium]|nr:hypothetical protein [Flavobacteriaceae bacterium]